MDEAAGSDRTGDRPRWSVTDVAIAGVAAIATALVHPVSRLLSHPYWVDEAWVADLARASWSRMVAVGSPTPVGFIALLKVVPGSGQQRARLVVVAFSVLTVVVAYVLARSLPWGTRTAARLAGIATAGVVMLAPVSLVRNDLKQYTCDAFCAVALLAIAALADREDGWSPWWLAGAAALTVLVSSTSAFVAAAVFAGLLASALRRGSRDRLRAVVLAGSTTGVLLAGYLALVVEPKLSSGLKAYWASSYLHGSPWTVLRASWTRLDDLAILLAMPAAVFVVLFVVGIHELARLRATAVAIAMPLLWIEMIVVGRLERYPFLDLRTAQFLIVSSLVVVAIGAIGVARTIRDRVNLLVAIAFAALVAALFLAGSLRYVHRITIPDEDIKAQTEYVAAHRDPRDVIVVSDLAGFGFAYYWPDGRVVLRRDDSGAGFRARVAGVDAVYALDRTDRAVRDALRQAVARRHGPQGGGRIFVVRTHLGADEPAAWRRAFAGLHLRPRPVGVGREPLLVVDPEPAAARLER